MPRIGVHLFGAGEMEKEASREGVDGKYKVNDKDKDSNGIIN